MGHMMLGLVVILIPIGFVVFALIALGVVGLGKAPEPKRPAVAVRRTPPPKSSKPTEKPRRRRRRRRVRGNED